jgi:hypothetical protein
MPASDLWSPRLTIRCGTTLLAATGTDDTEALVADLARELPADGLAARKMPRRLDLTRATTRLLDSRIIEVAATALDQDVSSPLVDGVQKFGEVREAARLTRSDPGVPEKTVILLEPYSLVSTHDTDVVLYIDDVPEVTIPFSLTLTVALGQTSVVVRHGAMTTVVVEAGSLTASFSAVGVSPPLWERSAPALSVHLELRPPVEVPLVGEPEATGVGAEPIGVPVPRRTTERPPVPARGRR